MSPYLLAAVIAVVALLALGVVIASAVLGVRRFGGLARAYRRQLAAETAMLEHRRAELMAELDRRRLDRRKGRTDRSAPRTMR